MEYEVGDIVVSRHHTCQGIEGVIAALATGYVGCFLVHFVNGQSHNFHHNNFRLVRRGKLLPMDAGAAEYIRRELGK